MPLENGVDGGDDRVAVGGAPARDPGGRRRLDDGQEPRDVGVLRTHLFDMRRAGRGLRLEAVPEQVVFAVVVPVEGVGELGAEHAVDHQHIAGVAEDRGTGRGARSGQRRGGHGESLGASTPAHETRYRYRT
jgi:hypothetical protein